MLCTDTQKIICREHEKMRKEHILRGGDGGDGGLRTNSIFTY
jgi:hypothetical protein